LKQNSNPQAPSASGVPPTYLEQKRYEAQQQYKEEQRYIEQHKEELERLLAMEQEQMAQQVPGSLWEAFGAKKKDVKEEDGKGEDGKSVKVEVTEGSMGGSS
jgi:import inner membrane translocase subunit TIM50